MTTAKPSIFISYSHKDVRLMKQLATHLGTYQRAGLLNVWDDHRIQAGQEWTEEIERAIQQAKVAVFLISSDFLDSDFICGQEVPPILERRARDGVTVVPVILKTCNWQDVPWLKGIQARPAGKPLFRLKGDNREAALAAIAKEIKELLQVEAAPRPASPPAVPPIPAAIHSAVHQLPAPPLDFTGREAELKALRAAVREDKTTAILGVRGLGGVGKTALALKLAHEVTPLYPDGQIFLDLLGTTSRLSAAEAMTHVIRSFHPGNQLPASEAELAAFYRSVLHGKRVLLLMDNAAGKDQVQPLLPPEGSALLVTSRGRFALPGLVERNLDELPREKSRKLLFRICPRIGKHAEDLAKVCGDLPLALRVAASTLQERRTLSPESYLQRLSTGRERLEPVDKALSLSYELLSEALRLRWCQLAVFPDTFNHEAAAAVWEVDAEVAEPILAEIERNSLLEWKTTGERYRLHDLVRSFAEERLEEMERRVARERHARHYLEVLKLTRVLYRQGGDDLLRGLKLFDLEWLNIQAGQDFAAAEATHSDEGARLCSDYPDVGVYCLDLRQTPLEQVSWLVPAVVAAQSLNDRAAEGRHLGNLGLAYTDLGEPRRAIEFHEQYLAITRELGNRQGEGDALGCLGTAYKDLGEPRQAIEFYEQCLAIAREIGNRRGEGRALCNLGLAYAALREPRRAIESYEQHLAISREIGDRHGEGSALGNLGLSYADLGEPLNALEFYRQALAIFYEIGSRQGQAKTSWNLGLIYGETDPAKAVELMQVLVDFEREIGHTDAEADAAYLETIRARLTPIDQGKGN